MHSIRLLALAALLVAPPLPDEPAPSSPIWSLDTGG
jgi:hypothetical protein